MLNLKHTAAAVSLGLAALSMSAPASAQTAPTLDMLQKDGPYQISSQTIKGNGFGGGTVYSPNQAGHYAVVAVCPGFVSFQGSMAAISKRLATHGFVVTVIDTNTPLDFPSSRATQLLAALKATTALTTGPVAGKMDTSRQVVSGWSMGGGGTLEAAGTTPGLIAAVAYAPWDVSTTKMKTITIPTAIIGGSADVIAPVASHSQKFYDAIPASTKKMLGVIKGASHFFPNSAGEPQSYTNIAWMKRFVDGDTSYGQFLTGDDPAWSSFVSTGPF